MTEFLALFSQETRHAGDDLGTVNLRTTTPKGVGVLIDHYSVTGQRLPAVKKFVRSNFKELGRAGPLATKVQGGPGGASCRCPNVSK